MTPEQRTQQAMTLQTPDRVPVMCQLALGHYFLHAPVKPLKTRQHRSREGSF